MERNSGWPLLACLSFFVLALSFTGQASAKKSELQVLYSFTGGNDGAFPGSALVVDQAGNLYGTTSQGGSDPCLLACGTIFKLSVPSSRNGAWKETVLYRFTGGSDGGNPAAGLVRDQAGDLYGTTYAGGSVSCPSGVSGCGVIFELSPPSIPGGAWTETVLHTFSGNDGSNPVARLTFDQAGNLYGTAVEGGIGGSGVVFELMAPAAQGGAWTYSVLHSFPQDGSDGSGPAGDLVFDTAGNVYGTTSSGGGGNSRGTVFELAAPAWTETILYSFAPGAGGNSGPQTGVIFDQTGNLYGTTYGGGSRDQGTVFELMPAGGVWTESVLFNGGGHAANFSGDLLFDKSGDLYGTGTAGGGALFRLQNQGGGWKEAELDLVSASGPRYPTAALAFGKLGALYGTSRGGGVSQNCRGGCGTVFGVIP